MQSVQVGAELLNYTTSDSCSYECGSFSGIEVRD